MIDSSKRGELSSRRRSALAAMLGLALALGGCGTMADIGEATSDGVSTAANAMNPFNWFGGEDEAEQGGAAAERAKQERAVSNTATKTGVKSASRDDQAQRAAAAQDEDRYPKLSTVPERPKAATSKRADLAREELREGLVADTANARYTDKELRAQTASPAARGQPDLARSNERVAGDPPVQPAPTMPVAAAPAPPPAAESAPPSAAPPAMARPQTPSGGSRQQQAAAASAAPVLPVAPPAATPSVPPERQASLAPSRQEPAGGVLKTAQVATIYFGDGSSNLSSNDRRVIDTVAEVARRTGGTLRIVGHSSMSAPSADAERAAMVNYKVSLERANAVAEELARLGVPISRMQVMAEGARNPIYVETSPTGAAGNRRTEIYLEYREQL